MRKFRILLVFALLLIASVFVSELSQFASEQTFIIPRSFSITSDWLGRHDRLTRLDTLKRVLSHIHESYVDPNRIDAPNMFRQALEMVSQQVPEVRVLRPSPHKVVLVVNQERREFDTSLSTFYGLRTSLSDALKFVRSHKNSDVSDKELEIATVAGILETLDPHSVYLSDDIYRETRVGTTGKFGGLGIVIGVRDGKLTVIAPLEGTPAFRAGLKAKDHITKIENESTINMSLTEAVQRMRGPKGAPVTISVAREGWVKGKEFTIVRDIIRIVSVESELLPHGVGYVKVKNFQGNTTRDLTKHLRNLRVEAKGQLKGLILDLRNNPGGLLDQATAVTDKFLRSGPIVTTVGFSNTVRDQETATAPGTEPNYPMVVLVNEGSASASEIVSGGLQRRDRALVMGRKTFGKGSVQSIYELPEEAALKLTIAQYLTPGDFSIQEIGIVPDINIRPATVTKERVDVFRDSRHHGEVSLERHLKRPGEETTALESHINLRYLEKRSDDQLADEYATPQSADAPKDAKVKRLLKDFEINTAWDILQQAANSSPTRQSLLKGARHVSEDFSPQEEKKIAEALTALGIDWASPTLQKRKQCTPPIAKARTIGAKQETLRAGDTIKLALTLQNPGPCTLYQAWARSESKHYLFRDREFLFGKVAPGEKIRREIEIDIPKSTPTLLAEVTFEHHEAHGIIPNPHEMTVSISDVPAPRFAFNYDLNDVDGEETKGNGNGLIEPGETIELRFRIQNIGESSTEEASASIKNLSGPALFLKKGRNPIPKLAPGKEETLSFLFEARKPRKDSSLDLRLTLSDPTYRIFVSKKLSFHVATGKKVEPENLAVSVEQPRTPVYAAPTDANASEPLSPFGYVENAKQFSVSGRYQDYFRVPLSTKQFGWVNKKDVGAALVRKETPPPQKITRVLLKPPQVQANIGKLTLSPSPDQFVDLKGSLIDDEAIKDFFVFVNSKKVHYSSYANETRKSHKFDTVIPLEVGENRIVLVTRDFNDLTGQKAFIVLRSDPEASPSHELAERNKATSLHRTP